MLSLKFGGLVFIVLLLFMTMTFVTDRGPPMQDNINVEVVAFDQGVLFPVLTTIIEAPSATIQVVENFRITNALLLSVYSNVRAIEYFLCKFDTSIYCQIYNCLTKEENLIKLEFTFKRDLKGWHTVRSGTLYGGYFC